MRHLFILFILISCSVRVFAQPTNFQFTSFNINNGLSGNWINCVLEDSRGYMWIGTRYGLVRYDGYKFKSYNPIKGDEQSLSGNRITKLFEDKTNNLWIGSWQSGISKYDRERDKFVNFNYNDDVYHCLNVGYVKDIAEDIDGNLWVVTGNSGILIFNEKKHKIEYLRNSPGSKNAISSNNLTSIITDSNEHFWISSRDGTIDIVNCKSKLSKPLFIDLSVYQHIRNTDVVLFFDSDSLLWIGSGGGGLFSYDIKAQKYSSYPKISNNSILKIIQHGQEIIVATDNGGINVYNKEKKSFSYITVNPFDYQSIKSNGIYDIYFDSQGLFWVSTFDAGLQVSRSKIVPFKHYYNIPNIPGTISHNNVAAICETEEGRIFVGTDGGGVNEFFPSAGKFSQFNAEINSREPGDLYITCMYHSNNKLYVAAYEKGLKIYDLKTNTTTTLAQTLEGYKHDLNDFNTLKNVWSVYNDSRNYLWIGTINNGLFCIDREQKTVTNYIHNDDDPNSISHNGIICILEDSNHNLWIGTEGGGLNLFDYKKGSFSSFKTSQSGSNSISSNSINSLYEDKSGMIWIGTAGGGLCSFYPKTREFKSFYTHDGLPSNIVFDILEDSKKNLWISTTMGLSRFNRQLGEFVNFTTSDGLQSNQFSLTSSTVSNDSLFIFGGVGGLNVFYPDKVVKQTEIANLVFTDFKIFNKSVRADTNYLARFNGSLSSDKPKVRLSYKDYVFSIEFAALDFISPNEIRYSYKMEGFDKEWNETDAEHRLITYTNLPGGEYTFLVRAAKQPGKWSNPIEMKINVVPPIYKTTWFIVFCILALIIAVVITITLRTRILNKQRQYLEKEVDSRTQEVKQQNVLIKLQNEELEKHRSQLEEIVDMRTKDLVEAKKKAEKADMLKTSFLANMSHEIRTPMNAILGFVNLLFENDNLMDQQDKEKYLSIINNNGHSLLKLIDDIIDIAKIESDQIEIITTYFNLIDLLNSLYIEYSESHKHFRKTFNSFQLDIGAIKEAFVYSDEARLRSVLVNFLENAVKFTENGKITIGARENTEKIVLFVSDTGPGIDPEYHQFIFERFTKVEESREKLYRGTGIGLYISKRVINLLGFEIGLTSEPGHGSEFYIEIPRNRLVSVNYQQKNNIEKNEILSEKHKTILIVEDEVDNYEYLDTVLQLEKINTVWAKNGAIAIEILRDRKDIDLILMDIKMPVMNGIDATKQIREFNRQIPIIAQTAHALSAEKKIILDSGCNDYIAKPIGKKNLLDMIKKYI
jgi:signal transduction histidine kinase/ligand-binding sensor domain-containing protein